MLMKFVNVVIIIALLCVVPLVKAETHIDIFMDETFSVTVNNEGFAAYNALFNFTIPPHTNATLTFILILVFISSLFNGFLNKMEEQGREF